MEKELKNSTVSTKSDVLAAEVMSINSKNEQAGPSFIPNQPFKSPQQKNSTSPSQCKSQFLPF